MLITFLFNFLMVIVSPLQASVDSPMYVDGGHITEGHLCVNNLAGPSILLQIYPKLLDSDLKIIA